MTTVDLVAVVLWLGVTLYAIFGGADFGAGFWDLAAGGSEPGIAPRTLIAEAIAPVWEANHTWLIFDLVILWTAFPPAFASIMSTLVHPAHPRRLGDRPPRLRVRLPSGRVAAGSGAGPPERSSPHRRS